MLSSVKGIFQNFSGNYEYDEKTVVLQALNGTILTNSINTNHEDRDKHLKKDDMLDTVKFSIEIEGIKKTK